MPSDWFPKVLNFSVDEATFIRIECEMREEKHAETELMKKNL